MSIVSSSLCFLLACAVVFIGSIFQNHYILGAVKIINDSIVISEKLLFLQAYFYTWVIFITYNLYLSLFHFENFLIINRNIFYLIMSALLHFIIMFICAIYEVGIKKVMSSIYKVPEVKSASQIALSTIICFSNILAYFNIKPLSIICRIVLNIKIGDIFNDMLHGLKCEYLISGLIKLVKAPMYLVQMYIIVLLSKKFYEHLTSDH